MIKTIFSQFVEKYFRLIVGQVTELFNGRKTEEELLHKTMLREEYSPDLTWGATEFSHSIVAADVVSMDSSLPLKHRGVLGTAMGTLPKLGIKYFKGEKDITDINIMIAKGTDEATVAGKIFDDVSNAIRGVDVRTEIMFLQALSTGMTLVTDEDNQGTGIRVNFGYREGNTFHAIAAKWGDEDATPIDDIEQMIDKAEADGNYVGHVWISKKYFDLARKSQQGKELCAMYLKQVVVDKTLLVAQDRDTFLAALESKFEARFHIIKSVFQIEGKDGKLQKVVPWEQANVIATPTDTVGRLVYGTLAEESNPVDGVTYSKSGSHTLVAKYSKTDPLREFTTAQALCLPVIDGAQDIYILHAGTTAKDILSVEPESLSFTKRAQTKTASIHYDGAVSDLSAESDTDWLEVSVTSAKKLSVKVTANTGAERTATVTVTAGETSASVTVTQAGETSDSTDGGNSGGDTGDTGDGGNDGDGNDNP